MRRTRSNKFPTSGIYVLGAAESSSRMVSVDSRRVATALRPANERDRKLVAALRAGQRGERPS